MRAGPKASFPEGSLLSAMLGENAPPDLRRAARRLRAEAAPAVAVDPEIAALAEGLSGSDVSRAPAVADALPPLFWIELRQGEGAAGWIVEKRGESLSARGFTLAPGPEPVPETGPAVTLAFGPTGAEDEEARRVRGLVAVVALPGLLAQMGEPSPVLLVPAEPPPGEAAPFRGLRLSVATSPDAMPQ